jgi:hypothetical protein
MKLSPIPSFLHQLEKSRKIIRRFARKLLRVELRGSRLPIDCQGQEASDLIRSGLENDLPCMITRLGAIEMEVVERYLNTQSIGSFWTKFARYLLTGSRPFWWDDDIRSALRINTGFFPLDDHSLAQFSIRILEDLPLIDILGSSLPGVEVRMRRYFPQAQIVPLPDLEPYYHAEPWSQALSEKKVLVIHPFQKSIQNQYSRRRRLFQNPAVLPEFELLTLKAVQSIAGNPVAFNSWFDALDWMCAQIAMIDFDVAIIGAGAYGLPLAAFIKRSGKKAIHLGGPTQILFGIRGHRWDQWPFFQQLYNEYWVRPLPEEVPDHYQMVEAGCYW